MASDKNHKAIVTLCKFCLMVIWVKYQVSSNVDASIASSYFLDFYHFCSYSLVVYFFPPLTFFSLLFF